MNPKSALTLVQFSAIPILVGLIALNPALRFLLFVAAALSAAAPALFGRDRLRLAGLAALVASGLLAAASYRRAPAT